MKNDFILSPGIRVIINKDKTELVELRNYLTEQISILSKIRINESEEQLNESDKTIFLDLKKIKYSHREAYVLLISGTRVQISANTVQGLFYGIQSLKQTLIKKDKEFMFKSMKVEDYPRFKWRGMMLDTCRHFFNKEFVKKFIDYLAMYKMNIFHFHLTEDQGWRVEIKKYPKLAEISAYRDETLIGHYRDKPHRYDGTRYGGYYTQSDIKEIVSYATKRYVTVVPEIEMPGHSGAAIAAYPELACIEGEYKVKTSWGVFEDVYCAGKDSTFEFLENVLSEVIELFPSDYIHIGGDECPKIRWKECELCQKRIEDLKLKDEHELQSYFIKRIEKFLISKGKRLIGWDEILEGGLAPEATVMSWRGIEGGVAAARAGHDVVMSPTSNCYFDYYQGDSKTEPLAIGGYTPLGKVYDFNPVPEALNEEEGKHILGVQANLWTEYIKSEEKAEYMLFPRLAALSEVAWTKQENKDWKDFLRRVRHEIKMYKTMGINSSSLTLPVEDSSK
jgi:hexosaminidase